jgi:hypothetical protein
LRLSHPTESLLQTPTGPATDIRFDQNTRKTFLYLRSLLLHLKSNGEKFEDDVADKLIGADLNLVFFCRSVAYFRILSARINLLDKNSSDASPDLGPMV